MSIVDDFKDLVKIVRDGGLEVVTRIDGTGQQDNTSATTVGEKQGTQEERKTYKIYDTIGIRTTIQVDADYVTIASREVLTMPELWKRHAESLKKRLSVLERVQGLACISSLVIFVPGFLWFLYVAFTGGFSTSGPQWLSLPYMILGVAIIQSRNQFIWWMVRRGAQIMLWLGWLWARNIWRLANWQRKLRSCLFHAPAKS